MGISPPVRGSTNLATVEQMVRASSLPTDFAYQVMVYQTLAKFLGLVVDNPRDMLNHSLVRIIESEIDMLRSRFDTSWTSKVEVTSLAAKLLVNTTVLVRLQKDNVSREILMRNTLSVAVRIIYLMDKGIVDMAIYPRLSQQSAMPKNYYRTLLIATTFLLRFFVLNKSAALDEQELARNHVAMARNFFAAEAKDYSDERAQGARLFDLLGKQVPVDLKEARLNVDDRMGASLFYDAVTMGHRLRDLPVEVEQVRLQQNPPAEWTKNASSTDRVQASEELGMSFDDLNPLDFSLPRDIWGDNVWGMLDDFAPMYTMHD